MLAVDDLKDIVILSYLSEAMQQCLLPYLDVFHFDEGETIFTEGDRDSWNHIIALGHLPVFIESQGD